MTRARERPTHTKWSRRMGGVKVCGKCKHRHKPVVFTEGKAVRVKVCVKCAAALPAKLTYPKKGRVRWYVREFDPTIGKSRDHACQSSEDADEFIRRVVRDYTPNPVQQELIEYTSVVIRQIDAGTRDDAINELIVELGGDPVSRTLKSITWDEARDIIAGEMIEKGKSGIYVADLVRVLNDFRAITSVDDLQKLDLDAIAKYRSTIMAGGWKRGSRTIRAIGGRAVNKNLATLSAFLNRAVKKRWVAGNVLEGQPDERIKVKAVRVEYMSDEDLRAIIKAAENPWMRAFIILAYYTAARRNDVLRIERDRDIDLDGTKVAAEGRTGPHIYVQGAKADTPHWMALHPAAVEALRELGRQPVIGPRLFGAKGFTQSPTEVSRMFAKVCVAAGVTKTVDHDGEEVVKNRWSLHDLRRKASTDLRNRGASPKERAALLGHRTTAVNEANYEAILPDRERGLIDALPAFGMTA